jgi:hypothetical protein
LLLRNFYSKSWCRWFLDIFFSLKLGVEHYDYILYFLVIDWNHESTKSGHKCNVNEDYEDKNEGCLRRVFV